MVAYGVSPAGPRGLYEVFADDRPARLISPGERDYHCDVSRDGRWAVVDTTGPHDAPGCGWENALDICDILIVDMKTGRREFLARSRQYKFHPRHPHPVFSPDGSTIFYNEAESGGDHNRIMEVLNPWKVGSCRSTARQEPGFRVQGRESNCQIVKVLYIHQILPPEP